MKTQQSFIVSPLDDDGSCTVRVGGFHRATFIPASTRNEQRDPQAFAHEHGKKIAAMFDKASRKRKKRRNITTETKRKLVRGDSNPDEYNAAKAEQYARWLAARDGIAIDPRLRVNIVWSGFYSSHRKKMQAFWNGSREVAVYCKRIQAVEWGMKEERFNTRKDGRRGAWICNEFVPEVRIDIPHWDFEPTPAIEETVETDSDYAELAMAA